MLEIRRYPELATADLWDWLRPQVGEVQNGRASRILVENTPLPPPLATVARAVYPDVPLVAWVKVNLQYYADGQARTTCHSDIGAAGDGFVLSLGATRTFFVHRVPAGTRPQDGCGDADLDARTERLAAGDVAIMSEDFHAGWHHALPAEPGLQGERIGLVFRQQPRGTG